MAILYLELCLGERQNVKIKKRWYINVLRNFAKLWKAFMEPVGVEPTSKHLPIHSSTTIGYVFDLT